MEIPKEYLFLIKQIKYLLLAIALLALSFLIFQGDNFLIGYLKFLSMIVGGSICLGFLAVITSAIFYYEDGKFNLQKNFKLLSYIFGVVFPAIVCLILSTYDIKAIWIIAGLSVIFTEVTIGMIIEK